MAARHTADCERVYVVAWSSGGPAAYATLLDEESPVRGGLIAMSRRGIEWLEAEAER